MWLSVDVGFLIPRNGTAELHLKSWPKGLIDARLPLPPLRLASAARLGLLPDSSEIEHAGLLIHVGNVELERSPSGDREYRWVVVNDTTGLVPIKLYVSAGPTMVKQRLVPGYHVFATHLAVSTASHLGQKRRVYLRGTPETQVTVFDPEDSEGLWFAEGVKGLCVPAENRLKEYTGGLPSALRKPRGLTSRDQRTDSLGAYRPRSTAPHLVFTDPHTTTKGTRSVRGTQRDRRWACRRGEEEGLGGLCGFGGCCAWEGGGEEG